MIPTTYKEYYGDETRWFVGTVVQIHGDPFQLGRVKVRIYGVHPDDPVQATIDDLPWASVVLPSTEGGSSGIGANVGLKERAQVFGVFLDGKNSQLPLVLGSIPKNEHLVSKRHRTSREKNERARGSASTDVSLTPDLPETTPNADKINLKGDSNVEKAFNFFISTKGGAFTPEQTCGILGNLAVENGIMLRSPNDLDPTIGVKEADGAPAVGLAQWNDAKRAANVKGGPSRLNELKAFSADQGLDYRTMTAQLRFIHYELFRYPHLGLAKLKQTDSIDEAAVVFEKKYERPQPGSSDERIFWGRTIFEEIVS
tara:strand:+ start:3722 stop:4660 length:939 start_codon:yes stop_codon:yes gene_type:complete